MYLRTTAGIREAPSKRRLKQFFCKHRRTMSGENCSPQGLTRISGLDGYTVCLDCGKILSEIHVNY